MRKSIMSLETIFKRVLRSALISAGHLCDAKAVQLKIAERFIGTELLKLVKTCAGTVSDG
jgi:hypothetical protein